MTTDSDLPLPLVPAGVDLRDFDFFPMDVARLRSSEFAVETTGDEFRAGVLLWCASWHEVPAASLPDNDRLLASLAGYGRGPGGQRDWTRVRAGALHGFVLCADGRLYHRVLAAKALEAWDAKLRRRHSRECERIKKAAQRAGVEPSYPTFGQWREHLATSGSDRWEVPPTSPGTNEGQRKDVPAESGSDSRQGTVDSGQGIGDKEKASPATAGVAGVADDDGMPPCPHQEIIALYHAELPELDAVRVWNDQRRKSLRARWREDAERQSLDWWKGFFAYVRECPFLVGRQHNPNASPFYATLEWLIAPRNFVKVIEGRYKPREAES